MIEYWHFGEYYIEHVKSPVPATLTSVSQTAYPDGTVVTHIEYTDGSVSELIP